MAPEQKMHQPTLLNKKSQITLFIVLGIVILIIFGFLFFVKSETTETVLESKIERIFGDFLSSTSIENFIQTCLERATKNAIVISSLQGGKIYDHQVAGGYRIQDNADVLPMNEKIENLPFDFNLTYGIRTPSNGYPPNHPLVEVPTLDLTPAFEYTSPFARIETTTNTHPYTLTALCNYYGPNYYGIPNASFSCETYNIKNDSIQQYLKLYILNRTRQCVSGLQFETQSTFEISEGRVTVTVTLGNNDIDVALQYPLKLEAANAPTTLHALDFSYKPKFRLKKIHELAIHLIGHAGPAGLIDPPKADADNIFFNITTGTPDDCFSDDDQPRVNCKKEGMNVTKRRNHCLNHPLCDNVQNHAKYADIINISDGGTIIDGQPLVFLFAVENRPPVVDLHLDGTNVIKRPPNTEISFVIRGRDPDEDVLTYTWIDDRLIDMSFSWTSDGYARYTIDSIAPGERDLTIEVSDDEGLAITKTFTLDTTE